MLPLLNPEANRHTEQEQEVSVAKLEHHMFLKGFFDNSFSWYDHTHRGEAETKPKRLWEEESPRFAYQTGFTHESPQSVAVTFTQRYKYSGKTGPLGRHGQLLHTAESRVVLTVQVCCSARMFSRCNYLTSPTKVSQDSLQTCFNTWKHSAWINNLTSIWPLCHNKV